MVQYTIEHGRVVLKHLTGYAWEDRDLERRSGPPRRLRLRPREGRTMLPWGLGASFMQRSSNGQQRQVAAANRYLVVCFCSSRKRFCEV
jgi:hypothetical protein